MSESNGKTRTRRPKMPVGPPVEPASPLATFLPPELGDLRDVQKAIPRIAKDTRLTAAIEQTLPQIPTTHQVHLGDSREMVLQPESVHLVLTSPPYWTLKEYN